MRLRGIKAVVSVVNQVWTCCLLFFSLHPQIRSMNQSVSQGLLQICLTASVSLSHIAAVSRAASRAATMMMCPDFWALICVTTGKSVHSWTGGMPGTTQWNYIVWAGWDPYFPCIAQSCWTSVIYIGSYECLKRWNFHLLKSRTCGTNASNSRSTLHFSFEIYFLEL